MDPGHGGGRPRGDLALDAGDTEVALARYLEAMGLFIEVDSIVYTVARAASVANALSAAGEDEQSARSSAAWSRRGATEGPGYHCTPWPRSHTPFAGTPR